MSARETRAALPPPAHLSVLQGFLVEHLQRAEPIPDDPELSRRCEEHVTGNERVSPAEQVDIYRRQFWLRHRDVLREDYPGLCHILGDDGFDVWARAYLTAHPPKTPSLRDLGADSARFSETWDGFPPGREVLARDMARYELSFVDVFDGPDPEPLDPAKVAAIPPDGWERARIVMSPLVTRLRVTYPVHTLRWDVKMMLKNGGPPPPLPDPAPTGVALFRKDLRLHFEPLDDRAYALLDALDRGDSLVSACAEITRGLDEATAASLNAEVGQWFEKWARWGWFTDVLP